MTGPQLHVTMRARDRTEKHRASSPLELLFDLTFVVAISSLAVQLSQEITAGHAASALLPYLMVFFASWWAWMNFTWFGSGFDTDDVLYRIFTLVQMAGVLVLAAGSGLEVAVDAAAHAPEIGVVAVVLIALIAAWVVAVTVARSQRRSSSAASS